MNFLQSDKKSILVLFIIYMIANSFLLLNYNGIYWDDWTLYGHSFETIDKMFSQAVGNASYPTSLVHYFLLNTLNGVIGYRLLTVGLLFLSGVFIYQILKNIGSLSSQDRFFIVLFILLAPLYSAKIALIDFPYTFYSTFFFFAFYLLAKNLEKLTMPKRVLILMLFFASFLINSILVFYAIVLIYIFHMKYFTNFKSIIKDIFIFCKQNIDFIILPIVFYVVKSIYFIPSDLYGGYNSIGLKNILLSPLQFINTLDLSFIKPLYESLVLILPFLPLLLILLIFLPKVPEDGVREESNSIIKKYKFFITLGFIVFFLGSFAYLSVGKIPYQDDWNSRFQLLLPLGFSFILYFGIKAIANIFNFKKIVIHFVLFIFIFSFLLFQIKDGIEYNTDWLYRESIVENLKRSNIVRENSTFIVEINLNNKLAKKRILGFYEMNGISKRSFGIDNKFFTSNLEEIEMYKKYQPYEQYNFSTWKESDPVYLYIEDIPTNRFNQGMKSTIKYLLKLKYLEFSDKESFKKEIINLVNITAKKEE